jgi:hypothetical protein
MKRLILLVGIIAGFAATGLPQGTITFDGSNNSNPSPTATSSGLVFINGVIDSVQDINAELLYGTTPTSVSTPVVTLLLSSSISGSSPFIGQTLSAAGDIYALANGHFYDNSGLDYVIPNIPAGQKGYFVVEGWTGSYNSYADAVASDMSAVAKTAVFTETLLQPYQPPLTGINNMPALNLFIPEPSTLTMAGVGIGSILLSCGWRLFRPS